MGVGLLLLWVIGSLLVIRVLSGEFQTGQSQTGDRSQFESAFQWVSQIGASDTDARASKFGINQMTYNRWRRSQNQPYRNVSEISEGEAKRLYQTYWQQEHCGSYAAPLDATCLDTMVSFGMSGSRSTTERFFSNLPTDPQAAAIAVLNRRIDYRQQLGTRYGDQSPNSQTPLRGQYPHSAGQSQGRQSQGQLPRSLQTGVAQGLRRDQELLAQVEAYRSPQPSGSLWAAGSTFLQRLIFPSGTSSSSPSPQLLSSDQIRANAEPFTVEVWITLEDGTSAPATGIVVADGLILTNAHVVEGNPRPTIHTRDRLQNEQTYSGQVIADDRSVDMALIQISARGLPIAPLADSTAQVKVGDTVYALGSPVGFHWKLTTAKVIEVQSQCGLPGLKCIRMPRNFLHPGNSGGPLLDATGMVIGINRAVQGSTGEGVSIPVEEIKRFLQEEGLRSAAHKPDLSNLT
jgi:hypothetical protein